MPAAFEKSRHQLLVHDVVLSQEDAQRRGLLGRGDRNSGLWRRGVCPPQDILDRFEQAGLLHGLQQAPRDPKLSPSRLAKLIARG
jgi:hypothetical protein